MSGKAGVPERYWLVGGGTRAVGIVRHHFRRILPALGSRRPLVAYVGAASGDDPRVYDMFRRALGMDGRMRFAHATSRTDSVVSARALLDDCDLVLLSTGDVDRGMRTLEERGLAEALRSLGRAGKPMMGVSAGALMLGRSWVRFPCGRSEGVVFSCLGLAPVHVDAHSQGDHWRELRALLGLLAPSAGAPPLGYGVPRDAGLEVRIERGVADVRALRAAVVRLALRRGRVVDLPPLLPSPPAPRARRARGASGLSARGGSAATEGKATASTREAGSIATSSVGGHRP